MHRRLTVGVLMVAVLLCAARAEAQGWRWLEKLSGPGHFIGYELDVKVFCGYEAVPPAAGQPEMMVVSTPCVFKRAVEASPPNGNRDKKKPGKEESPNTLASIARANGQLIDLKKRVFAAGVAVSYMSGQSELSYDPPRNGDRTIRIFSVEGFYDRRIHRRIDAGVAAGPNFFIVPAADNFMRFSAEPRVTFKLLGLHNGNRYLGTASLRFGLLIFFEGFDAGNFGAIPGTFSQGTEVNPSIRFILDFDGNPFKRRQ